MPDNCSLQADDPVRGCKQRKADGVPCCTLLPGPCRPRPFRFVPAGELPRHHRPSRQLHETPGPWQGA